jgi:hypothetical protein
MQRSPDYIDTNEIRKDILKNIDSVLEIHDFHLWELVDGVLVCTMHVILNDNSISEFNTISKRIHSVLHKYGVHNSTIQPEFVNIGNFKWKDSMLNYDSDNTPLLSDMRSCRCEENCDEDQCCSGDITHQKEKIDSL